MAISARRLLQLLPGFLLIILLLVGGESRYEKRMEESSVMDLAELMKMKDIHTEVYCCYDNRVRSCIPGTEDESHCNSLCLKHPCEKGGRCKVFGQNISAIVSAKFFSFK